MFKCWIDISKLDQPWCEADLYYIEKISAIFRRLDTVNNQQLDRNHR